ncbi:hypothetical protein C0993_010911 [Termitomyces sp. T159_Od127]|nr:hypothetical protein C0993_010911 [Termitomyces sp. T159_Od127]
MIAASNINAIDVLCAFLAVFILGKLLRRGRAQRGPLPPGPKGYPVVGNVLDMPSRKEWETFRKWGNICSVTVLGQTMVILNSAQVAREMLETKGLIYSDRPVLQMAGNLVGWRNSLGLMQYGNRFRLYRRLLHDLMGSKASVHKFSDVEQIETHRFVRRVLANPADLAQHIRHTAGAIITRITYGYEVKENDDVFVELANKSMAQFSVATTPGGFVVDVFPQRQLVSLPTLRTK